VALDADAAADLVDDDPPALEDVPVALSQLPFTQRVALVMREVQGYSYAEIAEALELSPSAVETLLFRARRAFREQLESRLTCTDAERAISRQLDGELAKREKGQLRAHLRSCPDCATLARRARAQRSALKALVGVPLPASLGSFFGGGGGAATLGGGAALKAAAFGAAALAIGGGGYSAVDHAVLHRDPHPHTSAAVRVRPPVPTAGVHRAVSSAPLAAIRRPFASHVQKTVHHRAAEAAKQHGSSARRDRKRAKATEPLTVSLRVAAPQSIVHAHRTTAHGPSIEAAKGASRHASASAQGRLRSASAPGRTQKTVHDSATPSGKTPHSEHGPPGQGKAQKRAAASPDATVTTSQPVPPDSAPARGNGNGNPHADHASGAASQRQRLSASDAP